MTLNRSALVEADPREAAVRTPDEFFAAAAGEAALDVDVLADLAGRRRALPFVPVVFLLAIRTFVVVVRRRGMHTYKLNAALQMRHLHKESRPCRVCTGAVEAFLEANSLYRGISVRTAR
jgi:hypothetical protein